MEEDSKISEEVLKIAKKWYTERRGLIVGNTTAWDDLSGANKLAIMDATFHLLGIMEEAWESGTRQGSSGRFLDG